MSEVKAGQKVSVHYVGTFDDGTEFDNSRSRGEPITFELGGGRMIAGFEAAITEMVVGETKTIRLSPEEAYGPTRSDLTHSVSRDTFPSEFVFAAGATVQGQLPTGQLFNAKIESFDDESVVLDLNHPMAGRHLNFEVELLTAN